MALECGSSKTRPDSTARFRFCGFGKSAFRHAERPKCDRTIVICLSYKIVNRDTKHRAWIGVWKEDTHLHHSLHLNPFAFDVHEHSAESHRRLVTQARKYRFAQQTYSKACELLREEGSGLILSQKTYYNLIRYRHPDNNDADTITGLLTALKDNGFRFRTRTEDEYQGNGEDERLINRKLIQIFFYHSEAVQLLQRFLGMKPLSSNVLLAASSLRD